MYPLSSDMIDCLIFVLIYCCLTFKYAENGEGLQIIHYEVGQKFEPHYDYNFNWRIINNGGPRVATVLMYL